MLHHKSCLKFLLGFIFWKPFLLNSYLTHFQLWSSKKIYLYGYTIYWVLSDLYYVNFTKSCWPWSLWLKEGTDLCNSWWRQVRQHGWKSGCEGLFLTPHINLQTWSVRKSRRLHVMQGGTSTVICIGSQNNYESNWRKTWNKASLTPECLYGAQILWQHLSTDQLMYEPTGGFAADEKVLPVLRILRSFKQGSKHLCHSAKKYHILLSV